jgi:hypothetical protein
METPVTIYTVKGRNFPTVWEFQYDLNGVLKLFKLLEGTLTETQRKWLFNPNRFPYLENEIKGWKSIKNIELIIGQPNLEFDTFWDVYKYKIKRVVAERAWKKLSKADRINAIKGIEKYDGFLKRKHNQSKANPATYLNQRYWEDNYGSLN